MKKIFSSLIMVILILTVCLTGCGKKVEKKVYTLEDFPPSRIMQTIAKINSCTEVNEDGFKYKYEIECDMGKNKFISDYYSNYSFQDDLLTILYAEENDKFFILEAKTLEEVEKEKERPIITTDNYYEDKERIANETQE